MATVSVCMIVKNEEKNLPVCLDCLKDLADEIVIVDTGSSDGTKEIAKKYGAKIYDFAWTDSFSDARNYAFSKATCDFIYSADADETIDEENQERFKNLISEISDMELDIDIVQMYYCNQLENNTVYNYDRELRPKLYRRVRSFIWQDPIHESVKLEPTVVNSDIEIVHHPAPDHSIRDLSAFRRAINDGFYLSKRLHNLYSRELFIAGSEEDFMLAKDFFLSSSLDVNRSLDEIKEACCVLAHIAVSQNDLEMLLKFALKDAISESSSEMCYELGRFYQKKGDYDEAIVWYYNAAYEANCILDAHHGGDLALRAIAECYRLLGDEENAADYEREADEWEMPSYPSN